jgi:predicted MPP superfamily phosphohydrolase
MFVLASGWTAWSVWVVAAALVFTIAVITTFLRFRGWPFYPNAAFRLFVVRPFWYLQLMLPIVAAAGLAGIILGWAFHLIPWTPSFAASFAASFAPVDAGRTLATMVFILCAAFLLAGYIGSRRLRVRNVTASIADLPHAFDGFRIAQISDLHVGPHLSRRFLKNVFNATSGVRADAIVVTGDLIDDRAEDVADYARWFGALRAPSGVYAIPGNHDIYADWRKVAPALRAIDGLTLLVNESRILTRDGASIAIAGTGDPAASGRGPFPVDALEAAPDIARTLASVPRGVPVIALAHNPALWPALAKRGVALTLSGHTHWGQLAMPRLAWSAATPFLEHAMGTYATDASLLYIHPGTGYWGLPFRLGATAEVAVITLRRGPASISVEEGRY